MILVLITLALVFTQLSVLAFGGGNAILPEMQHQVVNIHHWMSAEQFSSLFAMAQAAPGPNMMIVPLITFTNHNVELVVFHGRIKNFFNHW